MGTHIYSLFINKGLMLSHDKEWQARKNEFYVVKIVID